ASGAAQRLLDEEAERVDHVVRLNRGGIGRIRLELVEAADPLLSVDDAERLALLVVEDVLTLTARVHAERSAAEANDLLRRVIAREAERVAEVRAVDHARLQRELQRLRVDV